MEAYALCVKDIFARRTGIRLGWIHFVLFGLAFAFLSGWATHFSLFPYEYIRRENVTNRYNPYWDDLTKVFERNWFCYVYLFYCLFMAASGFLFVRGVKRSKRCNLLPLLVLSLFGIKFSADFMDILDYGVQCYAATNSISISLVAIHVFSFIWALTHYLQLKYTPAKIFSSQNIQQTL